MTQVNNRGMPIPPAASADESEVEPQAAELEVSTEPQHLAKATVAPGAPVRKGIAVVAMERGFYKRDRKEPGAKFLIEKPEHLGLWMALADETAEKKRRAMMKAKREADKLAALKKQEAKKAAGV